MAKLRKFISSFRSTLFSYIALPVLYAHVGFLFSAPRSVNQGVDHENLIPIVQTIFTFNLVIQDGRSDGIL